MITTSWDKFDQDEIESKSFWIAELSNGVSAIQDGEDSWIRLRNYCLENNVFIEKLLIKFRSHIETAFINSDDIEAFFLCRSILGGFFSEKNWHSYVVGKVVKGKLTREKWQIPEVIKTEDDEQPIDKFDERCFLWKKQIKKLQEK